MDRPPNTEENTLEDTQKWEPPPPFAVISDIHANLEALSAVLRDIEKRPVKEIYCLGDLVGYGPDPERCIELVMKHCKFCLVGNHDWALVNPPVGFRKEAAEALDYHRRRLKPFAPLMRRRRRLWEYLQGLPQSFELGPIKFFHASPRDPIMEYVLPEDVEIGPSPKMEAIMEELIGPCFIGHTHLPGIFTDDYDFVLAQGLIDGYEIGDRRVLINVGAVGQPRDGDQRACYVTVENNTVRFHRVPYDVQKTAEKIRSTPGLSPKFAERLFSGQ